jgi:hypothetical protein
MRRGHSITYGGFLTAAGQHTFNPKHSLLIRYFRKTEPQSAGITKLGRAKGAAEGTGFTRVAGFQVTAIGTNKRRSERGSNIRASAGTSTPDCRVSFEFPVSSLLVRRVLLRRSGLCRRRQCGTIQAIVV